MGRPRKFDYAVAAEMRGRGMSYSAIGRQLGVSNTAVERALRTDYGERQTKLAKARLRAMRKPCSVCGLRMVWTHTADATGICGVCTLEARVGERVRDGELYCSTCDDWHPDEAFYRRANAPKGRRGRAWACKEAERRARKDRRARARSRDVKRPVGGGTLAA